MLIVAGRFLGEQPTRWHVGWTAVGVLGVAVSSAATRRVRGSALGILLGATAMLTFTGYYLINRRARSTTTITPMEWMCGVTLFAGLFITPIASSPSPPTTTASWPASTGCTCSSWRSSSGSSGTR